MEGDYKKTVCRMCPNGCGLLVKVNNEGVAVEVKGDPDDPRTKGHLCVKSKGLLSWVYSPKRLLKPLERAGKRGEAKWRPISWEEALEKITNKLKNIINKYDERAISLYRGQGSDWGAPWQYAVRFMNCLGSPSRMTSSHICYLPRLLGKRATYGANLLPDWDYTNCVVIWGANTTETNEQAVQGRNIFQAKKRGAKLLVIDPIRTKLARKADLWLQIIPGTDCALALAFIHHIIKRDLIDSDFVEKWTVGFDKLKEHVEKYSPENVAKIVGVEANLIKKAAEMYANNKPGIILDNNGLDQYLNGPGVSQAQCILRSITGNIDVRGGERLPHKIETKYITLDEKLDKSVRPPGNFDLFYDLRQAVPPTPIIDAMLTGDPYPIKALIVQGGNPVVTLANTPKTIKALKSLDFIVVMDIFLTRTAGYADIVLPASTFLETTALNAYPGMRTNYLRLQHKVLEPLGESWPDWKFWFNLSRSMGFDIPWETVEEAIDEFLAPSGYTVDKLKNNPVLFPLEEKRYEKNGFRTPSGKVELYASLFEKYNFNPLPVYEKSPVYLALEKPDNDFPLRGTCWPRGDNYVHSQFRVVPELRKLDPEPLAMMNPLDAEKRGINNGSNVEVISPNGSIKVKAKITEDTRPGIIGVTWGWGEAVAEANLNDLIDDDVLDPICGSTMGREFICEIRKI